ncbi:hypothetical protein BRADI_5g18047v3 [Brachypodium distachyon]|uniref:Uncharacterized protein n=1 Tax=Brachypodium distachyon TaxID=15368 RepID=A0A0Q3KUW8_BRADI|nr:hypothetical protein BRADI_5g18047v3 [Brachypodium distachyon]
MKPPHPPPPPPTLSAAESDAPPKKRKLEEVGFQVSPYYKIRAAIANLRGRFLQVCQATDFQKKDAALEILKVRAAMNKPTGEVLYGEKNQVPQVVQEKVPLEPVSSQTAAKGIPFGIQQEAVKNQTNHQGERVQGTYVFGGSPIGWNFRTWPGGKAVYYGPTRAEWLARQAAK